ncbi:hypothetical protein ACFP81_09180 [Deinococcus lacus]|uniref:Uncharacterized protein n=1 Tax=Deinococcus lacus TaxID=392561 RepID=A0ABW1YCU5_9DEIO
MTGTARALDIRQVQHAGDHYVVANVNLKNDLLRLHWTNPTTRQPYLTFTQLQERLRKEGTPALFITNSGIYAPGFRPLGLHVEGENCWCH